MRAQNIYGNCHCPSKDIAISFSIVENLRFICDGGQHQNLPNNMYVLYMYYYDRMSFRCGKGLKLLYNCPQVQTFINSLSPKEAYQEKTIYQPGSLRKVLKAVTGFNFVLS